MAAETDPRARVLAWTRREQEIFCDRIQSWEHGTVFQSARYPHYSNLNAVRVEEDPGMTAQELIEFAVLALPAGLGLRIEFDSATVAEPLRPDFEAHGFRALRMLWMRFEGVAPPEPTLPVTEVDYDTAEALRVAWQQEDYPGVDASDYLAQAREVRLALGNRTLALVENSRPVGFAALDVGIDEAELAALYVLPGYRGGGRGTSLAQAAITAAGPVADLWIGADDEDRPKRLYARLGFSPVLTTMLFRSLS